MLKGGCSITNPAAFGCLRGRGGRQGGVGRGRRKTIPGGKEWVWVLKTSVFLLASLCNVWKEARPLHLAFGQAPSRGRDASPGGFAAWQEPPGSSVLAWLPSCPVLFRAPASACLGTPEDFASPTSSLLSWKQLFNSPLPSSAVQQRVGLICITKPCCKMLS